jgi:hydroxyacylglutathione hydrolase
MAGILLQIMPPETPLQGARHSGLERLQNGPGPASLSKRGSLIDSADRLRHNPDPWNSGPSPDKNLPTITPVPLHLTTAYIVRDKETILIDAGNPGDEIAIVRALRREGIKPDDVALILITHGHIDHYGSAEALRDLTGAPIAIHRDDADMMRRGSNGPLVLTGILPRLMALMAGRATVLDAGGVEPDISIEATADLAIFGIRGCAISTPGHTSGSISVLLSGGTAVVGDLLFPALPGRGPGFPFFYEDRAMVQRSIQKILSLEPERVFASHGGPWSGAEVQKRFRNGQ